MNPHKDFHFKNPYKDYEKSGASYQAKTDKVLNKFIEKYNPNLFVEVGSYLGASVIGMANFVSEINYKTKFICIDTWLGSPEFYKTPENAYKILSHSNGYPTLYYKFLSNVASSGNSEKITPVPLPSSSAATLLKSKNISPNIVYIDAGHEETYMDLTMYWNVIPKGAILIGDDYFQHEVVKKNVDKFVEEKNVKLNFDGDKYWIEK